MPWNKTLSRAVAAAVLTLTLTSASYSRSQTGSIIYSVSIDTSPLINHPAAPFSLSFQLNDGSGTGDLNNKAVVSSFQFGGGGAAGASTVIGDVSGDLSSAVVLNDSSFINFFAQPFAPGTRLNFVVLLTTNLDSGETPDQFSFSILDRTGAEIPTHGGEFFDTLGTVDINTTSPPLQVFEGDNTRAPKAGGNPLNFSSPIAQLVIPMITNASATPSALWPPNHKMMDVVVNYETNFGLVTCTLGVMSNEKTNGSGDGNTPLDWEVVDDHRVRLRAERAGNSAERIYKIGITCTDVAGNSASKSVIVSVPQDRSKK